MPKFQGLVRRACTASQDRQTPASRQVGTSRWQEEVASVVSGVRGMVWHGMAWYGGVRGQSVGCARHGMVAYAVKAKHGMVAYAVKAHFRHGN